MRSVKIDSERCNGCGLCVNACHEGALALVDGKAKVVSVNLCDGIGDCLPACPQNAITFIDTDSQGIMAVQDHQWPIQLALVSPEMPVFKKGILNIAADCTAFSVLNLRSEYIGDMPFVIGCPKLDPKDRFDKIRTIVEKNDIRVINILRMSIPCCSMLTGMVREMVSDKDVRVTETVFSPRGDKV